MENLNSNNAEPIIVSSREEAEAEFGKFYQEQQAALARAEVAIEESISNHPHKKAELEALLARAKVAAELDLDKMANRIQITAKPAAPLQIFSIESVQEPPPFQVTPPPIPETVKQPTELIIFEPKVPEILETHVANDKPPSKLKRFIRSKVATLVGFGLLVGGSGAGTAHHLGWQAKHANPIAKLLSDKNSYQIRNDEHQIKYLQSDRFAQRLGEVTDSAEFFYWIDQAVKHQETGQLIAFLKQNPDKQRLEYELEWRTALSNSPELIHFVSNSYNAEKEINADTPDLARHFILKNRIIRSNGPAALRTVSNSLRLEEDESLWQMLKTKVKITPSPFWDLPNTPETNRSIFNFIKTGEIILPSYTRITTYNGFAEIFAGVFKGSDFEFVHQNIQDQITAEQVRRKEVAKDRQKERKSQLKYAENKFQSELDIIECPAGSSLKETSGYQMARVIKQSYKESGMGPLDEKKNVPPQPSPHPGTDVNCVTLNAKKAYGFQQELASAAYFRSPQEDAVVTRSSYGKADGNFLEIKLQNGMLCSASHLAEKYTAPGTVSKVGQRLGLMGATGRVTGPHFHIVCRYGNVEPSRNHRAFIHDGDQRGMITLSPKSLPLNLPAKFADREALHRFAWALSYEFPWLDGDHLVAALMVEGVHVLKTNDPETELYNIVSRADQILKKELSDDPSQPLENLDDQIVFPAMVYAIMKDWITNEDNESVLKILQSGKADKRIARIYAHPFDTNNSGIVTSGEGHAGSDLSVELIS